MKAKLFNKFKIEINNSKNQNDVMKVVSKFDDPCNMDLDSEMYTGSDMIDNIINLDYFGEPRKVQKAHWISKDVINQDKHFLHCYYNSDFPSGFDLLFYESGKPASLNDVKNKALSMLKDNDD